MAGRFLFWVCQSFCPSFYTTVSLEVYFSWPNSFIILKFNILLGAHVELGKMDIRNEEHCVIKFGRYWCKFEILMAPLAPCKNYISREILLDKFWAKMLSCNQIGGFYDFLYIWDVFLSLIYTLIHSMQGWIATTRHEVIRKRSIKKSIQEICLERTYS